MRLRGEARCRRQSRPKKIPPAEVSHAGGQLGRRGRDCYANLDTDKLWRQFLVAVCRQSYKSVSCETTHLRTANAGYLCRQFALPWPEMVQVTGEADLGGMRTGKVAIGLSLPSKRSTLHRRVVSFRKVRTRGKRFERPRRNRIRVQLARGLPGRRRRRSERGVNIPVPDHRSIAGPLSAMFRM